MSKNYIELKVSELRDECKTRNLDSTGLKVHLIERLTKHDREQFFKSKTEVKVHTLINEKPNIEVKNEPAGQVKDEKELNKTISNTYELKKESEKNIFGNEKNQDRKRPNQAHNTTIQESVTKEESTIVHLPEPDNWENRTDVHLDFYNSDLNILIDDSGYSASPLTGPGFDYLCGGVKANYGFKNGKVFYEVLILSKLKVDIINEAGESNFIKVGWSTDNGSLYLGETQLSFAYHGSGKKITEGIVSEYGTGFDEGSVVGCFLEFHNDRIIVKYSLNGIDQGIAFNVLKRELKDHLLTPHVFVRNMSFEVNFGQNNNRPIFSPKTMVDGQLKEDMSWNLVGKVPPPQRIRLLKPPSKKSDCEVLMMCGLPSCGKTFWAEKHAKDYQRKRFNILSVDVVLEKMKVTNIRKNVDPTKWELFISSANNCLNKLIDIALTKRRNIILDQTNVYPTAQQCRMKPFKGYVRKAIIIVPNDIEYEKRKKSAKNEDDKDGQANAVLQMKENFSIPEVNSELFDQIIFIELQRSDAEELIRKYNNESKLASKPKPTIGVISDSKLKKEMENNNINNNPCVPRAQPQKQKQKHDTKSESNNEPSAAKRSRWSGNVEKKFDSSSRTREIYDHRSSDFSRKKIDYKGVASGGGGGGSSGFGYPRQMGDFDRSRDNYHRSDDNKYNVGKSFGGADRYVMDRFSGMSCYNSGTMGAAEEFRENFRHGNRNQSTFEGARPLDGGRGNGEFFERDRFHGIGTEREETGEYDSFFDERDTRNRFSQPLSAYNDRLGSGSGLDLGDFHGYRGGHSGSGSGYVAGRDSFFGESRNVPENREFQNYSNVHPYQNPDMYRPNNNGNRSWDSGDFNEDYGENFGKPFNYQNNVAKSFNRPGGPPEHLLEYEKDQKYGRTSGMKSGGARNDDFIDRSTLVNSSVDFHHSYGDRKPSVNKIGAPFPKPRTAGGPLGSNPRLGDGNGDDYSFDFGNNFQSHRFGDRSLLPSNSDDINASWGPQRDIGPGSNASSVGGRVPEIVPSSYSGTQSGRGGYKKFDEKIKPPPNVNSTGSREYFGKSSWESSNSSFDSYYYQSFDNSVHGNNKQHYANSGNKKPHPVETSSSSLSSSTNRQGGFSSSDYSHPLQSMGPGEGGEKSSVGCYPSGASGGGAAHQKFTSSNLPGGAAAGLNQQSTNNNISGSSGLASGYHQSFNNRRINPMVVGGAGNSNYSNVASSVTGAGMGGKAGYSGASNPPSTNTAGYTNPYNAIYKNSGISYYGQTNSYVQSGTSYGGDNLKTTSYSSSKPPVTNERVIQPLLSTAASVPASRNLSLASWGTGQYYGQN